MFLVVVVVVVVVVAVVVVAVVVVVLLLLLFSLSHTCTHRHTFTIPTLTGRHSSVDFSNFTLEEYPTLRHAQYASVIAPRTHYKGNTGRCSRG